MHLSVRAAGHGTSMPHVADCDRDDARNRVLESAGGAVIIAVLVVVVLVILVAFQSVNLIGPVLVTGGGGSLDGLAAQLIRHLGANGGRRDGDDEWGGTTPAVEGPSVAATGEVDDGAVGDGGG